jgi:hypothetical protein
MLLLNQLETYDTVTTVENMEAVVGTVSTTVKVSSMTVDAVDDQ